MLFTTLQTALPLPIQKLQVDNGTEFPLAFALTVQQAGMRLRYIKPRCPEQNGKVERSHRVDDEEFWSRSTFTGFALAADALLTWERRYNHERFSMALTASLRPKNLPRSWRQSRLPRVQFPP
jgi:transposase InsO family protein